MAPKTIRFTLAIILILHCLPIFAAQTSTPPSAWQRTKQFVREHRKAIAGTIIGITGAGAIMYVLMGRTNGSKNNTQESTQKNKPELKQVPLEQRQEVLNNELITGIQNNNYNLTEIALSNGAQVNIKDKNENTPLHNAIAINNRRIVSLLFQYEAQVDEINKCGRTPLMIAASKNYSEIAQILIDHHANINAQDDCGETALHCACYHESENIIPLLLQNGANVNAITSTYYTPLHKAVSNNNIKIITLLLDHGANPMIKAKAIDENGQNVEWTAIEFAHWKESQQPENDQPMTQLFKEKRPELFKKKK
jgi:hypothetical protein